MRTLVTTLTNQVTLYVYKSLKIWGGGGLKPPKSPWCLHPCNSVKYEECMWMKVRSERKREALYIRCVYMPTDSTSIYVVDSCYERLKEDVLT